MAKTIKVTLPELPESYRKVLHYFFSFPEQSISLNELAKKVQASKTAAKAAVVRLAAEGLLQKELVGNAWRIAAVPQNPLLAMRKIPYNLGLIYESGILARVQQKMPEARAIVLFGSYRWGTDNEQSDIDLGVEVLGSQELRIELLGVIEKLGFRRKVHVNLQIFSRTGINLNLFTNIANGIVLAGLLEVQP